MKFAGNAQLAAGWLALSLAASASAQTGPIHLEVDASDAPRNVLHAHLHIPAQSGPLTLLYPKWLPGEHGPDGPINDLTGLKMSAGGKIVEWQRDADDMCAFHVEVPAGANAIDVTLDALLPTGSGAFSSGVSSTPKLLDLSWNQVLLYPKKTDALATEYVPSLRLPRGWKFGTALPGATASGDRVQFATVTLETLVDSPVIAGEFYRMVPLGTVMQAPHELDIVADSAAALEIKPADAHHFEHLVNEANAMYGAHHYRDYHFLLTLSDSVAHFGLEHHESSDNRAGEKFLTDEDTRNLGGSLLPHEMMHSWNGKYRRPAGLATPDFDQPMEGELLWVYEGLTTYLGNLLATRSGLWTNQDFLNEAAYTAASLDIQPGRTWRPLADTAIGAQLLYHTTPEGSAWRRRTDFYPEGALIWLEADTLIRRQSQGRLSLDDFCKRFHGGTNSTPRVVPYGYDDVVATLNDVVPYAWKEFFDQRIYRINLHAPMGGIENGGWRLTYTNQVPAWLKVREGGRKFVDMTFSIGLMLKDDGYVNDVLAGMPADKAGVSPGMKLVAVNGRRWTTPLLRGAVSAATTNRAPVELLLEHDDYFQTCRVEYHSGEKYPVLARDTTKPDLLAEILKPLAPEPAGVPEPK